MSFRLLSQTKVQDQGTTRTISLYEGDLTMIPPEHALDLLVISAFRDDYIPTPNSLIGALDRRGISVMDLARNKAHDLRRQCAFWLSHPIAHGGYNIGRIACFESQLMGEPTALVGDLFRGLFPFLDPDEEQVVGLPLLSTGNQGWAATDMMEALVDAGMHWLARGLPVSELKIVLRPSPMNAQLIETFRKCSPAPIAPAKPTTDVFLSYSSVDRDTATKTEQELLRRTDVAQVFNFRSSIKVGQSWQHEIDTAIQDARAMVALISPDYLKSPECQEELMVARLRHKHDGPFLYPIWWRGADEDVALWLKTINIADCRQSEIDTLVSSVQGLLLSPLQ